jgi:hypothetical protein
MKAIIHLKIAFELRPGDEPIELYEAVSGQLTARLLAHKEEFESVIEQFYLKRLPEIGWKVKLDSDPASEVGPNDEVETL